jgi:Ca-activated chloride channel family protein
LAIVVAAVLASMVALTPTAAYADPPSGKLLLVLDSSGSMKEPAGDGHSKITNAKEALSTVVSSLDPAAQVGLRVYGATVFDKSEPGACTDSQLVVPIGPAGDKKMLEAATATYKPYGETPIAYALRQAGKDLGSSGQRTIVLVSDGEETCNENPCDVAKDLAGQGIDLRIDVIGLDVSGKARNQLKCVASKGKGSYTDADNVDELTKQLDTAKERALRPFQVTGTPVKGAEDQLSAPAIGSGRWSDKIPSQHSEKYYKLRRTIEGSTFWVGISAELKLAGASFSGVDLTLNTEGGETCGRGEPTVFGGGTGSTTGLLFGMAVSRRQYNKPECYAGDMILGLSQRSVNKTDAGGAPVQLDVFEEPPVSNAGDLPPQAGQPVWTQMSLGSSSRITGGTTFDNAPLLKNGGTYTFDVAPGDVQIFKVSATWGQRIQVLTAVGSFAPKPSSVTPLVDLDIVGPYGGQADAVFAKSMPTGPRLVGTPGSKAALLTPEIRYNNVGTGGTATAAALAGSYYVTLSYPNNKDGSMPILPLVMKTAVLGTAGAGAPAYAKDGVVPTTPSSTPSAISSTSADATPSAQQTAETDTRPSDDSTPWGLIAGMVACAVVLGTVGVVAVRMLRRG